MVSDEGRGKKNTEIRCIGVVSFRYEFTTDSENMNRIQCGSIFTGISWYWVGRVA
jgi:hypothetical protein